MGAAQDAVHHGRFPGKEVHVDRRAALCRFQRSLLHGIGAEQEIYVEQILRLVVGIYLGKGLHKLVSAVAILLACHLHRLFLPDGTQGRHIRAGGKLVERGAYHYRDILALCRRLRVKGVRGHHAAVHCGRPAKKQHGGHAVGLGILLDAGNGTLTGSQQFFVRHGGQLVYLVRLQAQFFHRQLPDAARVLRLHVVQQRAALYNGFVEQPLGCRSGKQVGHLATPTRLSKDGHVGGIAPKSFDILVYPLQCGHKVQQTDIARLGIFPAESGKVKETQHVQAMVQRHHYHVALLGQVGTVVRRQLLPRAGSITAAMQPYHDGAFLPVAHARRPDVDAQAVLIGKTVVPVEREGRLIAVPARALGLRAGRPVGTAAAYALPAVGSRRRHEAFGLGIRNALVDVHAVFNVPGHLARLSLRNGFRIGGNDFARRLGRILLGRCRQRHACREQQKCRREEEQRILFHAIVVLWFIPCNVSKNMPLPLFCMFKTLAYLFNYLPSPHIQTSASTLKRVISG